GFGVPPLPTPHCRTAHTGTAGHLQHRQPFGREQNNAGTLHMLHRPGAITNDRFQADAILVADDDTKILGHTHSMPYSMPMTHLFQSIHSLTTSPAEHFLAERPPYSGRLPRDDKQCIVITNDSATSQ